MQIPCCPHCGASLSHSRQDARLCPECGHSLAEKNERITSQPGHISSEAFSSDKSPSQPPLSVDEDHLPSRWRWTQGAWGVFRTGLSLMFLALLFFLFFLVLQAAFFVLWMAGTFPELAPAAAMALFFQSGLALMYLIGMLLCCGIPKEAKARDWVPGFIVAIASSMGLVYFHPVVGGGGFLMWLCQSVGIFGLVMGYWSNTMILRRAAEFWGDIPLGLSFLTYFVVSLIVGSGTIALLVGVANQLIAITGIEDHFLLAGGFVISVFFLGWYSRLLYRLMRLIPLNSNGLTTDP